MDIYTITSQSEWHKKIENGWFYIGSSIDGLVKFGIAKNEKNFTQRIYAHNRTYNSIFSKEYAPLSNWRVWKVVDYKALEFLFFRNVTISIDLKHLRNINYHSHEWLESNLTDDKLDNMVYSLISSKNTIKWKNKKSILSIEMNYEDKQFFQKRDWLSCDTVRLMK